MDLGLDEAQQMLKNSARAFLEAECPDTYVREMEEDEAMTHRALVLLGTAGKIAYEEALASLQDDTRESWEDVLSIDPDDLDEDEEPATADAECL